MENCVYVVENYEDEKEPIGMSIQYKYNDEVQMKNEQGKVPRAFKLISKIYYDKNDKVIKEEVTK